MCSRMQVSACKINIVLLPQELETLDNGKPYAVSYSVDLPNVVKCFR